MLIYALSMPRAPKKVHFSDNLRVRHATTRVRREDATDIHPSSHSIGSEDLPKINALQSLPSRLNVVAISSVVDATKPVMTK